MFARVRVPASPPYEALLVPDVAIGTEQARKYVVVVDVEDTARIKYVTLGQLTSDDLRVIKQGVGPDDRVVVNGLDAGAPRPEGHAEEQGAKPPAPAGSPPQRQSSGRRERMRISHFFIDRPIFASVVSIIFVILGGVAFWRLPVAQYPEIAPPTITVYGPVSGRQRRRRRRDRGRRRSSSRSTASKT